MEIEMILMRQLASYLTLPIFVIGMDGNLIYFNEAASRHVGRTFEEAGEMPLSDLSHIFQILREDGSPYPADELPIAVALRDRCPKHDVLRFRSLDGEERNVETTAFPLEGHGGRNVGAVAVFWDEDMKP